MWGLQGSPEGLILNGKVLIGAEGEERGDSEDATGAESEAEEAAKKNEMV